MEINKMKSLPQIPSSTGIHRKKVSEKFSIRMFSNTVQ